MFLMSCCCYMSLLSLLLLMDVISMFLVNETRKEQDNYDFNFPFLQEIL